MVVQISCGYRSDWKNSNHKVETMGAIHSTKNSGETFQKFPWANGTDFSSVENDKPHSFVRLEFFNDFEV